MSPILKRFASSLTTIEAGFGGVAGSVLGGGGVGDGGSGLAGGMTGRMSGVSGSGG